MKKILFLASALFLGWSAFATEPQADLLSQGFDYFDDGTEQVGANSIQYNAQYKGAGWDLLGADLLGEGYTSATITFTVDRPNSGQVTLNVSYFDADGEPYSSNADPTSQVISSAAAGEATINFKAGYTVDKIHIQSGWNDPAKSEIGASATNPVVITFISAELNGVVPQAPASVSNPISFEDFDANFKFAVGNNYYPMPAWGWADDTGAKITVVAKDGGKSLKVQPKNSDLAAIFKTVNLPAGKTVADIKSITFNSYWESYAVDGEPLEEGADVENTEAILFFGDPSVTLGAGTGFASGFSFKGNPTSLVGIIGDWVSYTITIDDILDADVNKGIGADNYGVDGYEAVSALSTFTFGIGFNANNGAYYLDNIEFSFDGSSVESVASSSSKVYAIDGGLAIVGGEKATVYGIDGSVISTTSASTIALPKGVYIVKVGGEVVKAIVK